MKTQSVGGTNLGQRRENNEDRYLIDESLGLYIVCDGLGGAAAGEEAAEQAIKFAADYIRRHRKVLENAHTLPDGNYRVLELAEDAAQEASRRVYELANTDAEWSGMRTTMTMLLIVNNKGMMAHVGDSRLYVCRGGELHQLSSDHTFANELVQNGSITEEHPVFAKYKNMLTRSVGQEELVQVESLMFDLFPRDICLLCTDGLSNYFHDLTTIRDLLINEDLRQASDDLIKFANLQGGDDNITLILARTSADSDNKASDIQDQFEKLKSTFLCKKLSASRLMRVLNITSLVECSPDQELLPAGQSLEGMYIVLDGQLTLEDDVALSDRLRPGDYVGETCLLREGKMQASLVANETSRLMFIPRSKFTKLSRRIPKLGNALLENLGEHLSARLDDARYEVDTISEDPEN